MKDMKDDMKDMKWFQRVEMSKVNSNPRFINPKCINDGLNNNSNPHFINPKSVNDGQD